MRPHRPLLYMQHAMIEATRSTCFRGNVGCVIVDQTTRSIIATGYNGPRSGEPHCTGHVCEGASSGCRRSVHAETNALDRLDQFASFQLDLYVTLSPCGPCMTRIGKDIRIKRLFYCHEYRDVQHMHAALLGVYRITPAGYITQFNDTRLINPESFYAKTGSELQSV